MIEGTYPLSPLKLNLYNWSEGNKKDLKCDLWNCSGYDEGNIYYIKGDIIIFKLSVGTISYKYKLEKRNNETYLILSSNNKRETKYKKVK